MNEPIGRPRPEPPPPAPKPIVPPSKPEPSKPRRAPEPPPTRPATEHRPSPPPSRYDGGTYYSPVPAPRPGRRERYRRRHRSPGEIIRRLRERLTPPPPPVRPTPPPARSTPPPARATPPPARATPPPARATPPPSPSAAAPVSTLPAYGSWGVPADRATPVPRRPPPASPVPPPAGPLSAYPKPAARARAAGLVVDGTITLPPMWSWTEFVERAAAPDSTSVGHARRTDAVDWAGAGWAESLRLATDGWTTLVPDVDMAVTDLRWRMTDATPSTRLVQVADTCGSEVDVAAHLAGVPECMLETEIRSLSTQGRVVTFVVPASYANSAGYAAIVNRGKALCALCTAIVHAGHSVEVWSGFTSSCPELEARCVAAARVIAAGEPFDPARLMFAMAHPAMLRRLWCGVWDSADTLVANAMAESLYGEGPYACTVDDLPDAVRDAYVFPYLDAGEKGWADWDRALGWSLSTFAELGLVAGVG